MKITDSIVYVGANDRKIDLFESQYKVPGGISYNSYVILDEKICIMDTIDRRCTDEWCQNLERALGGRKPDYLVVSHMEPDHAFNISLLAEKYPEMKIIGNAKTFTMFKQFNSLDISSRAVTVAEGDKISLGAHTLGFYMAPMVHWPEVMVTYEESEKVLFSADGFGKFGAVSEGDDDWTCEARRYYFNIVGKYGAQVQALLKKAAALDIKIICPLHGPVLCENLPFYIEKYDTWSSYRPEDHGVMIAFASIHGNTAQAAHLAADKLRAMGEKVEISDLSRDDMAEAVEGAFRYDRMILASSTYDGGIFAPMDDFLHHLKSKGFRNRSVYLIENGTWAPMAAKLMRASLEGLKDISVGETAVTIRSALDDGSLAAIDGLCAEVHGE